MKLKNILILILAAFILLPLPDVLLAQEKLQDYERAATLRGRLQPLALNMIESSSWIGETHRFWYKKSIQGGSAFFIVDADTRTKKAAFDHEKLASGLAEVLGEKVKSNDLPFRSIEFSEDEKSVTFEIGAFKYSCHLENYVCKKVGPANRWRRGGFDMWKRGPAPEATSRESKVSPDGKWKAFIKNYNVAVRLKENGEEFFLSHDGSEGNYYTFLSLAWSPDSTKIAALRIRRGSHRIIHYVESSPSDQLQPKHHEMEYAAAALYPYYDISRVGIYGNSAGGQNALGGLLFHPEFYKVGVSSCGCHDNRMDKIWWNEQWMSWPVGPEYSLSSNVDNAYRLQGHLLLILGEMDTNVDPSSTMQVVNALIKANKNFDLLVIPGGGHGMGEEYGQRKMIDFFVRHLHRIEPPNWNSTELNNKFGK